MNLLQKLPKIDKLLSMSCFEGLNVELLTSIARAYVDELRSDILSNKITSLDENAITDEILRIYKEKTSSSLQPLINATGVIIHTNLGRCPLSEEIFEKAKKISCGYSNLEFDMKSGKRGERYEHVRKQLCALLDVEDVLVVNNNASAVFLVLNSLAKGKNAIVSRGELVEIGGNFRIPDVMRQSGVKLKEVGTTNKTKLSDYENSIGKKTALLMKVHRSNFSQSGFTQTTSYEELIALAKKKDLIDYIDVGGAYVESLPKSISDVELDLKQILKLKPSLVSFSGDKLLGSVQCGIIVGKKKLIKKLKQNQLLRMLRVDKITLCLLEETIKAYLEGKTELLPLFELLRRDEEKLKQICLDVQKLLPKNSCEVVKTSSFVGGGTMPDKLLPSYALYIKGDAKTLQEKFRKAGIIGRIDKERFLCDVKSIQEKELAEFSEKLKELV